MDIKQLIAAVIKDVRYSDLLDILFISVFIYIILVLFKHSKARFVLTGVLILSFVYLVSLQLNLVLTTSLLQAFFAVILLALIIIFQGEIRRFFEQIAIWSLTPKFKKNRITKTRENEVEILANTLVDLAKQKIGALIVVPGNSNLTEYIEGGERLNGDLSESLLKSIFDPHSVGHDGAVIIDKNKVVMFGAHLPLSKNFAKLKNRGTRHAAALGLSEITDAICLVVSEERGSISIARNGDLQQMDEDQIVSILQEIFEDSNPLKKTSWFQFSGNSREKAAAIVLSILLWFVIVHESKLVYKSFEIPIRHTSPPPGLKVDNLSPDKLEITFLGPRREFYFFNKNRVKVIIKIPDIDTGRIEMNILESNIEFPKDITLENFQPRDVKVEISKM